MDKLERVARALCVADGKDPDERLWTGVIGDDEPERAPPFPPPNWHRYRDEARRFVAAFEAMRAAELEPMARAMPEETITSGG